MLRKESGTVLDNLPAKGLLTTLICLYGFSGYMPTGRIAGILPDVRAERRLDPFHPEPQLNASHQAWCAVTEIVTQASTCNVELGPSRITDERFHDTSGTDERCGRSSFSRRRFP